MRDRLQICSLKQLKVHLFFIMIDDEVEKYDPTLQCSHLWACLKYFFVPSCVILRTTYYSTTGERHGK